MSGCVEDDGLEEEEEEEDALCRITVAHSAVSLLSASCALFGLKKPIFLNLRTTMRLIAVVNCSSRGTCSFVGASRQMRKTDNRYKPGIQQCCQ